MSIKQKHDLCAELELAEYNGMSDAEMLDALTTKNISTAQPIQKADIREYLRVTGSWLQVKRSISDAAELAMDSITEQGDYDVSNALVLAKLTEVLNGVVDDGLVPDFDAGDRDAILSLGTRFISRAEELGLGQLRIGCITEARAN